MTATAVGWRGSLLALGLSFVAASAAALDPSRAVTQYRHDAWNTREGLPQSSVESMAQTPDGYLWLGTQEGLAQFDGIRIKVFDKSNTKALRHNRVTALLADHEGSLWVGTEGGGLARLRNREWTVPNDLGLPNERVRSIVEDEEGTVWVGTDEGLVRLHSGRPPRDAAWDPRLRGTIYALHAGKDRLFVGVKDGLLALRPGASKPEELRGLPAGPVRSLWQDPDGTLWAGTPQGLFVRKPGQTELSPAHAFFKGRIVTSIRRDRNGGLWVGTEMAGLVRVSGSSVATLDKSRGPLERPGLEPARRPRGQPLGGHPGRRRQSAQRRKVQVVLLGRGSGRRHRLARAGGSRRQHVDRHQERRPVALSRRPVHDLLDPGGALERLRPVSRPGCRGIALDRHPKRRLESPARRDLHAVFDAAGSASRLGERAPRLPRRRSLDRHSRRRPRSIEGRGLHDLDHPRRSAQRRDPLHPRGSGRGPSGSRPMAEGSFASEAAASRPSARATASPRPSST